MKHFTEIDNVPDFTVFSAKQVFRMAILVLSHKNQNSWMMMQQFTQSRRYICSLQNVI
jgi:hypothetical protein